MQKQSCVTGESLLEGESGLVPSHAVCANAGAYIQLGKEQLAIQSTTLRKYANMAGND
jgi:hypothetical protein